MNVVDIPAYFARISYSGLSEPTAATLREIHRAHLFTVPFENLDISLGRPIVTEEATILNKIVGLRRGGFCYELNGAFAALLRVLGFRVTLLSARVAQPDGSEGPEFDHLTLRVNLDEPLLVDVGFGESFLEPLRLETGVEQSDPVGRFRLVEKGDRIQLERATSETLWKPQYSFALQPHMLEDFAGMCHYHQTSPDSHFTQNRICSRATPDGRITLSEMKLIVTRDGQRQERVLASEKERNAVLQEEFGIKF
jgi:N-hydroxyarylamine O-acetyltransferase